jgi:hypothetical protein
VNPKVPVLFLSGEGHVSLSVDDRLVSAQVQERLAGHDPHCCLVNNIARYSRYTFDLTLRDREVGNQTKESLIEKDYLCKDTCLRLCLSYFSMMIVLLVIPLMEFGRACVSTTHMGILFSVIWGLVRILMIGSSVLF